MNLPELEFIFPLGPSIGSKDGSPSRPGLAGLGGRSGWRARTIADARQASLTRALCGRPAEAAGASAGNPSVRQNVHCFYILI